MMFALCAAVTFVRPCATRPLESRTARSARLPCSGSCLIEMPDVLADRRPVFLPMNSISSFVAGVPFSNSIPVYMPSVFSRTTTRSTSLVGTGHAGVQPSRAGRLRTDPGPGAARRSRFGYAASTGVASGPFSATPVLRGSSRERARGVAPPSRSNVPLPRFLRVPGDPDAGGVERARAALDHDGADAVAGDQVTSVAHGAFRSCRWEDRSRPAVTGAPRRCGAHPVTVVAGQAGYATRVRPRRDWLGSDRAC